MNYLIPSAMRTAELRNCDLVQSILAGEIDSVDDAIAKNPERLLSDMGSGFRALDYLACMPFPEYEALWQKMPPEWIIEPGRLGMSCLHVMSAVRNPLLDAIVPTLDDACKADQFGGDFRDYEFVLSDNDRALTHYRNQIPADYWFERRSHPAVPIISKEIGRQLDRCENGGTRSVRTGSSSISGIGVFAGSHLNYGDLIGVYTGKMRRISDVLSDQIKWGHNPYLMFTRPDIDVGILSQFSLLKEWVIDARTTGGICRFINHSNTPNCTVSLGFWRGLIVPVIMVSASGGVPKNEECTISYGNHYGQFLSDRPIDSNF